MYPAVQPQRQQRLATQLHCPIGTATLFETDYRRGLLIHSRSPPDEIRFYWLCEKSPSHSCMKSAERCTLNIWHGKSKSITSEQMPLLLQRKSALCGNDLCHVPLIMVMIALEGVSWDVIQRAASASDKVILNDSKQAWQSLTRNVHSFFGIPHYLMVVQKICCWQ